MAFMQPKELAFMRVKEQAPFGSMALEDMVQRRRWMVG